jgi:hypothetical protein
LHTNRYAALWGAISVQFLLAGAYNFLLNSIMNQSPLPLTIEAIVTNLLTINIAAYVRVFDHQRVLPTAHFGLPFIPCLALLIMIATWMRDRRLADLYNECTHEASEIEKEFGVFDGVYTQFDRPRKKLLGLDHAYAFMVVIVWTVCMWLYLFMLGLHVS